MKKYILNISLLILSLLFIFSKSTAFAEDHKHEEGHDKKIKINSEKPHKPDKKNNDEDSHDDHKHDGDIEEGDHDDHKHDGDKEKGDHDEHKHDEKNEKDHGEHDHKNDNPKVDGHEEESDAHGHHDEGEGDHGEHESSKFGPGKAILEVKNEGKNFKLSSDSEKVIGIKFKSPISANKKHQFRVPSGSIVEYQENIGIFRKRGDWYELIEADVVETIKNESLIYSKKLDINDKVIFAGVGLLRVAHLEASGQGGKGHAH